MERRVYLDFNAGTPIAPEVAEAMRPYLTGHYGNPSSHHWAGPPAALRPDAGAPPDPYGPGVSYCGPRPCPRHSGTPSAAQFLRDDHRRTVKVVLDPFTSTLSPSASLSTCPST